MWQAITGLFILHNLITPVYAEIKPFTALSAENHPITTSYTPITEISVATTTFPSLPERIKTLSEKYSVDPKLANAIIRCESNYNQFAKNKGSSAESYWQFLTSTWISTMTRMDLPTTTSKFDDKISLEAGFFLLSKDGTHHWLSSSQCWNKG